MPEPLHASAATHEQLASRLRAAYAGAAIPPLRDGLLPTDAEAAYDIQSINTRYWLSRGRTAAGHKVGLTAKSVQAQLGVDQPDFGILFSDMQIDDGGTLAASRVIQPKVEAEVAIILSADINDPKATIEAVAAATAYAVAAIEIVDSRIANWKITFADTVADNGSAAYFILGRERKSLLGLDLYTCGMALEINGQVSSVGAGAACLGHPLRSAAWLARRLVAQGDFLRAGDVVLTGALGPMVAVAPGDHVRAVIGGLGSCEFSYVEDVR